MATASSVPTKEQDLKYSVYYPQGVNRILITRTPEAPNQDVIMGFCIRNDAFACCGALELSSVVSLRDTDVEPTYNVLNYTFFKKQWFWIDVGTSSTPWSFFMKKKGAYPIFSFHNPGYSSGNLLTMWSYCPSDKSRLDAPQTVVQFASIEGAVPFSKDTGKIKLFQSITEALEYRNAP